MINQNELDKNEKKNTDIFSAIPNYINVSNSITKNINFNNYFPALTLLNDRLDNLFPKNFKNILPDNLMLMKSILTTANLNITTAIPSFENQQIINIITEGLSSRLYFSKFFGHINLTDYTSKLFNNIWNVNFYYTDTINTCINEILNSNINLKNIFINDDIEIDAIEDLEHFDEKDKDETIANIKEIIDIAKNEKETTEQLIYNKLQDLKKTHPIIATAIYQIFWIIVSCIFGLYFSQSSVTYYNQNYITVKNNIVATENSNQDFIDNARYVIAEALNVRKGPSKNHDIQITLKYGTVVKVIDKINYWTKIEYKDKQNGISLEGWVYTRYLEKFDIEFLTD